VVARGFILFWGLKVTSRTSTKVDEDLVRIIAWVAALVVGYAGLAAAIQLLPLSDSNTMVVTRILVSVLILQFMRIGFRTVHLVLTGVGEVRDRFPLVEERTIPLFDLIFTLVIVGIAAYALLQVWELDPTPWLASAGIVGIAVGFAAKDTLANLFGGFFIIADAPYVMGDYVVLDTGERGEITKVGIRSTRMLTRDDVEVIIPNSLMANAKVVNESGGRWVKYRMRIGVGVAYGSDADQVVSVLERVAREHDRVCSDPEPRVRMRGFGDSSLNFELLCWVDHPSERGLAIHELYMLIYKELAKEKIEIPFPQRDVWMRGGAEAPE
jgi:small-conductance mechanosensitive channel